MKTIKIMSIISICLSPLLLLVTPIAIGSEDIEWLEATVGWSFMISSYFLAYSIIATVKSGKNK